MSGVVGSYSAPRFRFHWIEELRSTAAVGTARLGDPIETMTSCLPCRPPEFEFHVRMTCSSLNALWTDEYCDDAQTSIRTDFKVPRLINKTVAVEPSTLKRNSLH